ncbi:MAG: FMN-binding negative transcriptional regulator [Gammaproteobacteria bacterium]
MYIVDAFEEKNLDKIIPVFIDYPFATLVSVHQQGPLISQLPLSYDRQGHCFYGHLARDNHHYECFSRQSQLQVLFHGPQAYVSPVWYESPGVPTWNYVSVEVAGRVELIRDHELQYQLLQKQLAQFDPELQSSLLAGLPQSRRQKMFEMICGLGSISNRYRPNSN